MSVDTATEVPRERGEARAPAATRPTAIEVRDLRKTFRIPTQRVDTLKERATSLLSRREFRSLEALRGVDFEVESGEFFGIVGRNGSGKSTLLKLLASIYRPDSGRIRIAGRVAPCIELGVGFNVELTAYDNVVLNGVMMGLAPGEARERFDAVIEFAELGDYTDVKLKNYSSGMLVRLGFSLMTQVDADVLLIDEVLAVGDASFQQKCFDVFARLHAAGKTIILVTHDMASVETHCDRAILLESGRIDLAGDPADVARRYLELNFPQDQRRSTVEAEVEGAERAQLAVRLTDDSGEPATSFAQGERIGVRATVDVLAPLESAALRLQVLNADGLMLSAPPAIELAGGGALSPGDRVEFRARLANPLAAGHYYVNCGISRGADEPEPVAFRKNAADFVVFGTRPFGGLMELEMEAEVEVDGPGDGS